MWLCVALCACVGCRGWEGVAVDVDVTPTPSNARDPEQMARQGLSAEPELIACAMSYCLRRPPPSHFTPLAPHSYPDFCTQALPPPLFCPTLLSFFNLFPFSSYFTSPLLAFITSHTSNHLPPPPPDPLLHPPSPPHRVPCSSRHSSASFIHSFTRSFIHVRPHSSPSLADTHSQVGPLAEALWRDN